MISDQILKSSLPNNGIREPFIVATTEAITLSGLQTIDSVVLSSGDRVLVKDQTSDIDNGIFIASSSDWSLAPDFIQPKGLISGVIFLNKNNNETYALTFSGDYLPTSSSLTFTRKYAQVTESTVLITNYIDPGFTIVPSSDNSFTVESIDATSDYKIGDRIAFTVDGVTVYGVIVSSNYSSPDTEVVLDMEDGAIIPVGATSASFTEVNTKWASAANGGIVANAIATGVIKGVSWWLAVGFSGNVAVSNDAGGSWTTYSIGGTQNFHSVCFNHDDEEFMMVGFNNLLFVTRDCINFDAVDTTSLRGGTAAQEVTHIIYSNFYGYLLTQFAVDIFNVVQSSQLMKSEDNGVTWTEEYVGVGRKFYHISMNTAYGDGAVGLCADYNYFYNSNLFTSTFLSKASTSSTIGAVTGVNKWSLLFTPIGSTLVSTSLGGVYSFTTSTNMANGINGVVTDDSMIDFIMVVGPLGEAKYSGDRGQTWTTVDIGWNPGETINDIAYSRHDRMFIAVGYYNKARRSTSGVI